jgi:serine/threonine protein kinase
MDQPGISPSTGPSALKAGVMVSGRFELQTRLGAGGFAEVWYAIDQGALHVAAMTARALKFFRKPMSSRGDLLQQMAAEANIMQNLTHPNIVTLRDVGIHGDLPYLLLDYVPGGSLEQLQRKRGAQGRAGLEPDEALWLLHQICPGLEHAHQRVVHRDVKPGNILVTLEVDGRLHESKAEAKLTDFGLSTIIGFEGGEVGGGTPAFMSPELFQARRGDSIPLEVLRSADIYALGVTLYTLLSGRNPFPGSRAEIVEAKSRPVPPLETGNRRLDESVRRATAIRPQDRFSSALEFANAAGPRPSIAPHIVAAPARTAAANPALFARRRPPVPAGMNSQLFFGIANPGRQSMSGRVFFEATDKQRLVIPVPDCSFELRGLETDWIPITVSPKEAGHHLLRIRLCVNGRENDIELVDYESNAVVQCGNDRDGLVPGDRSLQQRDDPIRPEFAQTLADSAGCTTRDLLRMHVRPAFPASSLHKPRPGQLEQDRMLVTVHSRGLLLRRLHVLFSNEAAFGRSLRSPDGTNDFVWQHLPCRSQELDPHNWELNTRISRRSGTLRMRAEGSYVTASSQPLQLGRFVIAVGSTEILNERQVSTLDLAGLRMAIRARIAKGSDRDQCRLLEPMPLQSTLTSREVDALPRHHALVAQRLDDLDHVAYVLASPWFCIGGDPDDDILVDGLPPSSVVIASRNGRIHARVSRDGAPESPWKSGKGCWVPVVSGESVRFGDITIEFEAGDPRQMLQEEPSQPPETPRDNGTDQA